MGGVAPDGAVDGRARRGRFLQGESAPKAEEGGKTPGLLNYSHRIRSATRPESLYYGKGVASE